MPDRTATMAHIERTGVIAVMRGVTPETARPIADALVEGGITTLEVTADTPGATDIIDDLSEYMTDREVVIGAGTVLDASTARTVLLAGAEFIVTPTLNPEVIRTANRDGVPVVPGILTPTEAMHAIEAGADAVKLFPASSVGPGHISALHGPLDHVDVIPTGGVSLENGGAYFEAGATAIGVGSALVQDELIEREDWAALSERASAFADLVASART